MNLPSLIASAAGAISLFVGVWHLLVFWRGAGERTQLAFALTCLAIAAYDVCCIGGYLTTSVEWCGFWQRGEQATGALLSVPFVWFIVLTTRERLAWFAYAVSAYFTIVALLVIFAPLDWTLTDVPRVTHVALPGGLHVTYHELHHGPLLAVISSASSIVILAVVGVALGVFPRTAARDRAQSRLVRIGVVVFLLGALNDIAVSRQLYSFLYLMEVAYLGLILVVTWGMSNAVLELASTRAELRREHRRMQRIFDNVSEIYLETTVEGTIREVSPSAYRLPGIEPDLRGRSIVDLYDDPTVRAQLIERLKTEGQVTNFTAKLRLPGGEAMDGEISAVLTRDEETGQPVVVGSMRDVTARERAREIRVQLERQLQQAQKLESLGVLAGGIAHDFNNLLAAILGSIELAQVKLGTNHPVRGVLELGLQSGRRAAELTSLMLAYSGKGRFVVEPLDLSALVRRMRDLLAVSVTKRAQLECELAEADAIVEADSSQLSQVLLNLVINAAEAIGKQGGHVRIVTRVLDCDVEQLRSEYLQEGVAPGRYVALEVHDDGEGMDAETKQRLFDPFYTTKFSGRGLGLSAVLGIVRAHSGTVQVESQPGEGSAVRVLLPAAQRYQRPGERNAKSTALRQEQGDVLVIDDEPAVLQVAAQLLSLLGYQVTTASGAEAGLAAFEAEPGRFRLVVVDMTMPGLSGDEVLARMRQIRPGLPALLISGYSEDEVLPVDGRDPRTGFAQKPFEIDAIRNEIRSVVEAAAASIGERA